MRRVAVLVLLLAFLVACGDDSADPSGDPRDQGIPLVLVSAGGQSRQIEPLRICDFDVQDCAEKADAAVSMPIPPDTPVRVQVADLVSATPWQVAFRYLEPGADAAAAPVEGRTKVFAAEETGDYTLAPPPGAQLVLVEVQQFGLPADEAGELTFPIRASWLLNVTPAPGTPAAP